ncbi:MAG TPA: PKD domain-containing protein [Candidatus Saccharimonadales bacterium]|nr:PKD domain-containing protein [Candidatus Saccharimonadales bacterium]
MKRLKLAIVLVLAVAMGLSTDLPAWAANQFPDETSSGSIGLQGTISTAPPKRGATITVPSNGASFTTVPITVSGLCPSKLLVKIFANNVFVGSTICKNGSYSLRVNLFDGQNDLVARVYDALDQAGPDSNIVKVTFNDVQFARFGTRVQLTSNYAERGAPPGQELDWPIILSGGNGPYAISVDWGDGGPTDLMSRQTSGTFNVKHTYKTAGVYNVIVKATDKNGGEAFLQLVAVATGATQNNAKGNGSTAVRVEVLWWPALAMLPLIFATFWVGRRHELYTLRKQLEKSRNDESA